jgi:TonB-linked SusC/RagA family outer membrane protein
MKEASGLTLSEDELDAYARGVSTDWVSLVLDKGHRQDHHLGIRGGTARTGYALSAHHYNERGIVKTQDFNRYTFRFNFDQEISKRIRIGISSKVARSVQNWASSPYYMALYISPLAEPYDSNGNMVYRPGREPGLWNPLADYVEGTLKNEYTAFRSNGNIFAELDILKNLTYRLNFGPDFWEGRWGYFRGTNSMARQGGLPRAKKGDLRRIDYTFENILTFTKKWGKHDIKLTGLYSVERWNEESTTIDTEDVPYESQLFHNLGTAETVLFYDSHLAEWGMMSFMARVSYELMGRYMLTLTSRFDGSSRLAEGNKWGFFPSAAAMWRISAEDFMQGQTLLSDLRIRISHGTTGNTGIAPYLTWGSLERTTYSFGGEPGYGYRPGTLANRDLQWESSTTNNIGLDFGLWEQRLSGKIELYRTRNHNLLLNRKIPPTSGFTSAYDNIGETLNRGWETSLTAKNSTAGNFTWETTLNLSGNREEIVDLYGTNTDDVGNRWFIGQPLTVWFDYEKLGIWQSHEAEEAALFGGKPGAIRVRDAKADSVINQYDMVILGSDIPKIVMGLGARFACRGVDFSFLVTGAFGHAIYNTFEVDNAKLNGRQNNLDVDYWTETNPTNAHPKPDWTNSLPLFSSSRAYYPGDYIKIKNLQLGYSLPPSWLSRIRVKKLRFYMNLNTAFVWSRLPGNLDPEVYGGVVGRRNNYTGHGSDVPPIRIYSFGTMLEF